MTTLVNIKNETPGSSAEYSNFYTDGGNLTIETGARLAGTVSGMKLHFVANTNVKYGDKTFVLSTNNIRARFYFDPNSVTIGTQYQKIQIFSLVDFSTGYRLAIVSFSWDVQPYALGPSAVGDDGAYHYPTPTTDFAITDAPHYIEINITRESADGAADGTLQFYIDDVLITTISGIDNYITFPLTDRAEIGGLATMRSDWTGDIYLDELVINDTGAKIGPLYNPSNGAAVYGYNNTELTNNDSAIPWPDWDDGAAGAVTVSGNANWGKLQLAAGAEGRGDVIDFGDANPRTYTITENAFTGSSGQGDADLQIRGDTNPFSKDDALPAWTTYTVPVLESWRYVQVRESRE